MSNILPNDEKKLFLNVIVQIIEDFIKPIPVAANIEESKVAKVEAIKWFNTNSEDYKEVCDLANVDYNWLRIKVLNSIPPHKELKNIIKEYKSIV